MSDQKNTYVVVSGSSSGLGMALANKLSEKTGHYVYGLDKNAAPSNLARKKNYQHIKCDVSDLKNNQSVMEPLSKLSKIDVLINNAATIKPSLLSDLELPEFEEVIEVNFKSAFLLTKALLPKLNSSEDAPHVFNIGSTAGVFGAPYSAPYVCSKAALHGLTLAINSENEFFGRLKATTLNLSPMMTPMNERLQGWPGLWKENNPTLLSCDDVAVLIVALIEMRRTLFIDSLVIRGRALNNDRELENPLISGLKTN